MKHEILEIFRESAQLKDQFLSQNLEALEETIRLLAQVLERKNKLLLFGNGGSAADAQHMAAEFVNRFAIDRPPLAALALTTDTSVLTAVSNDFAFEQVFEKQIQALGKPDDAAIGISTSGKSANVIRGLKAAKSMGMVTIGLGGPARSPMSEACRVFLSVGGDKTARIQEVHELICHTIVEMVDRTLFGPDDRRNAQSL
ncbi:MAG: SIS domain-containing protein [Thermodesulfobacteriota bacterium]